MQGFGEPSVPSFFAASGRGRLARKRRGTGGVSVGGERASAGRGGRVCIIAGVAVAEAVFLVQLTGTTKGEATGCDADSRSGTELRAADGRCEY